MPEPVRIVIASVFSETPFGRYESDGQESGQVFRERHLLPVLRAGRAVTLDIDGVAGLPSSFWEEALGGSIRAGIAPEAIRRLLKVETTQADLQIYVRLAKRYIDEEALKAEPQRH